MSPTSTSASQDPRTDHGYPEYPPGPPGGRYGLPVLVLAAMAVVIAATIWVTTRSSGHTGGNPGGTILSGGDPGGRILSALLPVESVVPVGGTDASTTTLDSSYTTKCPDNPGGRSGWSAVTVISTFRSTLSGGELATALGGRLDQLGWHQIAPVWDNNFDQFGPQAAWQVRLFPGQTATASLYEVPQSSGSYTGSWHLNAIAKPPGFALPGC